MIASTTELTLHSEVKTYWRDADMEGRFFIGGSVEKILNDREFEVAIFDDPKATEIIHLDDFDVKRVS